MKRFLRIDFILLGYLLVLFAGTVVPLFTGEDGRSLNDTYTLQIRRDYWLHALVYIPLPILLGLYFRKRSQVLKNEHRFSNRRLWIRIIGLSLFITVFFESLQLILPYRSFNINDMAANGIGATIGMLTFLYISRKTGDPSG